MMGSTQRKSNLQQSLNYHFIEAIKALPYVDKIYLYGSRARGDNRLRSDIDLAIICPKASDANWFYIMDLIENADTLLKIDCVRYDTLQNEQLKRAIDAEKKVIYEH